MRLVYFTHSLKSCWNHGNAHFLRGVLRALARTGHDVVAYEPADGWSRANLLADQGAAALDRFEDAYPELRSVDYRGAPDMDAALDGADLVVVHEWTDPALVAEIGRRRRRGRAFRLLFHDTHHRAVSAPDTMRGLDLDGYDGVLAFGEALAEVWRGWGWGDRVEVWHEAADTTRFAPPAPAEETAREGVVWIGNWGDGERTGELESLLLRPCRTAGLPLTVHGVRYPGPAKRRIASAGGRYGGWLANLDVPAVFARHRATVHVPRRFYVEALPGIPTIRVFEALACGIPLASAWWNDAEGLFRPGTDYLVARDEAEMTRHLRALDADDDLRRSLAEAGLETIRRRHSCAHRAEELRAIAARLGAAGAEDRPAAPSAPPLDRQTAEVAP